MSKLIVLATAMTFAQASEVLANGGMVKRADWKEEFVFRQVPSIIQQNIVTKMQSLPDSVKAVFTKRFSELEEGRVGAISYDNQYALVNEANEISGYKASKEDAEATDWYEVTAEAVVEKEEPGVTTPGEATPAKGNEPATNAEPNGNTNGPA